MDPLVSVIIPVYKVEKYLRRCVDSVLGQTYQALEVILVDDGSPDGCPAICDTYAASDHRVRVIHKENGGVASARNTGLEIANGEYLYFADSDDRLHPQALEIMVGLLLKEKADIVIAERVWITETQFENNSLPSVQMFSDHEVLDTQQAITRFATENWAPWNRLYRRQVHKGIFFPNYKIYEDEAIMFQILDRCKKVIYTPSVLYYYLKRENSATTSRYSIKKFDGVHAWQENYFYIRSHHSYAADLVLNKLLTVSLYNLEALLVLKDVDCHGPILEILSIMKTNFRNIMKSSSVSWKKKIRVICCCVNVKLYTWLFGNR